MIDQRLLRTDLAGVNAALARRGRPSLLDDVAERDVTPLVARAAELLRDDDELLDRLAAEIDPTDAVAVSAAERPLARRALRRWLTVDGYPPDAAAIDRVLAVASGRAAACEVAGVGTVRRSAQRLSITPRL